MCHYPDLLQWLTNFSISAPLWLQIWEYRNSLRERERKKHAKSFYGGNVEVTAGDEVPSLHCHDILSLWSTARQVFPTLAHITLVFFYSSGPMGHEEDTTKFQEMAMAPSYPPFLRFFACRTDQTCLNFTSCISVKSVTCSSYFIRSINCSVFGKLYQVENYKTRQWIM